MNYVCENCGGFIFRERMGVCTACDGSLCDFCDKDLCENCIEDEEMEND